MEPRENAVRLVDRCLDEVFNEVDEDNSLDLPKRLALIIAEQIKFEFAKKKDYETASYWRLVENEIEKL